MTHRTPKDSPLKGRSAAVRDKVGSKGCGVTLVVLALLSVLAGSVPVATSSASSDPQIFFAPYDSYSSLQVDLQYAKIVAEAARSGLGDHATRGCDPENPYQIYFAVYNVLDYPYLEALAEAFDSGVCVRVLIYYEQLALPYVPTYEFFKNHSMHVAPSRKDTQKTLPAEELLSLNLVGIDPGSGLMHLKTRYFSWIGNGTSERKKVVVTGSMNPETTALTNDETLLVIENDAIVDLYADVINSTLYLSNMTRRSRSNRFDANSAVNVLYSQWGGPTVRNILTKLIEDEKEFIAITVYGLRDLELPSYTKTLSEQLCQARSRGVAVIVVTDKGESDGEGNFTGGDPARTAYRIHKCGIPVYKAKNYNSQYSAFHHKNAVFGLGASMKIVTDTANWSGASMGKGKYTPTNVETTIVLNLANYKSAAVAAATRALFLSNILYSLRSYAYQQACPYKMPVPPHSNVRDNCADQEPFHQPTWTMPNASAVLASLYESAGAQWPQVNTTFEIHGLHAVPPGEEIFVVDDVLGFNATAKLHQSTNRETYMSTPILAPFGSSVRILTGSGAQLGSEVIIDSAVDWTTGKWPVRRPEEDAQSFRLFQVVQA